MSETTLTYPEDISNAYIPTLGHNLLLSSLKYFMLACFLNEMLAPMYYNCFSYIISESNLATNCMFFFLQGKQVVK